MQQQGESDMSLISCPDCNNKISPRADSCPLCGCPARFFSDSDSETNTVTQETVEAPMPTIADASNYLITFEQEYQSLFSPSHFITQRELNRIFAIYEPIIGMLTNNGASWQGLNIIAVEDFLFKYESINEMAATHNSDFVNRKVVENETYFDSLLDNIDNNIVLDEEQRRAVV